jgi:hypothetical protein
MKLRNEQSTLSVTSYGLAQKLIDLYGEITSQNIQPTEQNVPLLGEVALAMVSHSVLPSSEDINVIDALNFLNNKIESARKTISF